VHTGQFVFFPLSFFEHWVSLAPAKKIPLWVVVDVTDLACRPALAGL
jgi:hypothetical protein